VPHTPKPVPELTEKELSKFWEKVEKSTDPSACWNWLGGTDTGGYGIFYKSRCDSYKAHRLALSCEVSPDDPRLLACHRCDNRKCCNPEHLYWGTQQQNMGDMCAKGRQNKAWGERQHAAKLSLQDVHKIRKLKGMLTGRQLASMFGVTPATISKILLNHSWKKA
jgi:hypothetical protein